MDDGLFVFISYVSLSFSLYPQLNFSFPFIHLVSRLSSLPSLIMNCLCFLSHFPLCPLVWSPLLILHLTLSPSLCVISPNSRPWMAPRLDFLLLVFVHPGTQGNSSFISLVPPPSLLLTPPYIFTAFTFFPSAPSFLFSPHHWTILSGL